jgi:lysyl-tRNA synthetase class 2
VEDISSVMQDRRLKMESLRDAGINPFANGFKPNATCVEILTHASETELSNMGSIPENAPMFLVAGRIMAKNKMGKATFMRIRDRSVGTSEDGPQHLQIYLKKDILGEEKYLMLRGLDVGDIIGCEGRLFETRTGEATLMVGDACLLTKSLRPLPEKWHGLADVETRYRQRYVDLIVNPAVKEVFRIRSQIISHIRRYFEALDYIEVETPMMHPIPGGATARPFETFHNALSMPLYLRVAPELYLKRLVVGGLERVFEVNRNFRNEGLSPKHNPEFTMLEFYQAYATYEDLMVLTEDLICDLTKTLNGSEDTTRLFGEASIDYKTPFRQLTIVESLSEVGGLPAEAIGERTSLAAALKTRGIEVEDSTSYGNLLMLGFDVLVEPSLIQPTFITQFPIENSPLARRNEANPEFTDRFELFIGGAEIANAFSELNDPIDQRGRFEAQVQARDAGDNEAMYMDLDYIRALEYGLPPTAGEGIGIDRLVMLMTGQKTIREVLFFPHMRPE